MIPITKLIFSITKSLNDRLANVALHIQHEDQPGWMPDVEQHYALCNKRDLKFIELIVKQHKSIALISPENFTHDDEVCKTLYLECIKDPNFKDQTNKTQTRYGQMYHLYTEVRDMTRTETLAHIKHLQLLLFYRTIHGILIALSILGFYWLANCLEIQLPFFGK